MGCHAHSIMTNASALVFKGACLVHSIFVGADGAAAQVDIYDGVGILGTHKYRINAISDDSKPLMLPVPTDFDNGIYVVVNANTTYVTVQYSPVPAGKDV